MKIHYNSGGVPRRGKYRGGVYQGYAAGQQLLSNKRNGRSRYPSQFQTAAIMAKVTRAWAFLTSGERDSWNVWAATYPQSCRYRSGCYLTGYQNFLQRNFYELLFFGINAPLITNPVLSVVADSSVTPQLTRSGADLLLDYNWSRSGGDIWAGIFVSHIVSGGKLYNLNYPRFVGVIDNGGGFVPLYGCLYNWYASNPSGTYLSSSSNWVVPTSTQRNALRTYLGNTSTVGGFLKEEGTAYWFPSNVGADNKFGFNGRGSGSRSAIAFANLGTNCQIMCSNQFSSTQMQGWQLVRSSNNWSNIAAYKFYGWSIRLLNPSTNLQEGEFSSYTGNDGKIYPTCCIGNQEWLAANLCESKFRDGSDIPYISGNSEWAALTSPGMCYYNNDQTLAYSSGSTAADISPGWSKNFGVLPAVGDYVILRFVKVGKANGQFLGEEQFTLPVTA